MSRMAAAAMTNRPTPALLVSLHTADPGEGGPQTPHEVAYTGYARALIERRGDRGLGGATWLQAGAENFPAVVWPPCRVEELPRIRFVAFGQRDAVLYRRPFDPADVLLAARPDRKYHRGFRHPIVSTVALAELPLLMHGLPITSTARHGAVRAHVLQEAWDRLSAEEDDAKLMTAIAALPSPPGERAPFPNALRAALGWMATERILDRRLAAASATAWPWTPERVPL